MNLRSIHVIFLFNVEYFVLQLSSEFVRTPEQSHKNVVSIFKLVKLSKDRSFLKDEPLKDLDERVIALVVDLVYTDQEIL